MGILKFYSGLYKNLIQMLNFKILLYEFKTDINLNDWNNL